MTVIHRYVLNYTWGDHHYHVRDVQTVSVKESSAFSHIPAPMKFEHAVAVPRHEQAPKHPLLAMPYLTIKETPPPFPLT